MPQVAHSSPKPLLAVDTGGTFTDFFLMTSDTVRTHKVLSTPKDPAKAILQGIQELGLGTSIEVIHGSTVATNAYLERKGARVALITTAGFEDILEIGRQNRPGLYDLLSRRTPPLVERKRRFGLEERVDAKGRVQLPPSRKNIQALVKKIIKSQCEAIAVVLLFSFRNSQHELSIKKALKGLKLPLSLSCEVCPEYREFERTSTTCINAYVSPIMAKYLQRLEQRLQGRVRVMQSNGGALSLGEASKEAARTLLSGPAGGALGALQVSRQSKITKVLTLDMGGTSTDMALIDGALEYTTEANLGGLPLKTPMIRIDTIGAGGGSLAWHDAGGSLRVGPQSAGADPGPICYGRGGKAITLTDAHVFLGHIPPHRFLGGAMKLIPKKIETHLRRLGKKLGLRALEVAQGIITVADANMARALRVLSLERGYDPREFTLMTYGGAGALHACALADSLGMSQVLIPTRPGILSAFGMAHADWVRDYVKTLLWPVRPDSMKKLQVPWRALQRQADGDAHSQGFAKSEVLVKGHLDVRFRGQSYELTIPFENNFSKEFLRQHQAHYGFKHQQDLEIVNLRLQARTRLNRISPSPKAAPSRNRLQPAEMFRCFWQDRWAKTPVFDRETMRPGQKGNGPAIITEFSATTLVPPGWNYNCEGHGHLLLQRKKS